MSEKQDEMKSYLPKYFDDALEMQTIIDCEYPEFEEVDIELRNIQNQFFIDSIDFTLDRWEKELGLKPKKYSTIFDYSTISRRNRIKAQLMGIGTFNKSAVIRLGNIFDFQKGTEFIPYIEEYKFSTRNKAINIIDFESFMEAFLKAKPAHIRFDPVLYTVVLGQKFKRYTFLNYKTSIMRTGESKSKRSINLKREIGLLYLSGQQIILDGGRKLDGIWILNGSQIKQPIKYILGINSKAIISHLESKLLKIRSTKTANIYSGSSVLNGAWLLNANQNLSGLRSVSVKIDGIAV